MIGLSTGPAKEEEEERLLAKLPYTAQAAFNSYDQQSHPLCLPNTRTDVLDEIIAWARCNNSGSERVFWLNGMAGTGKSTIARTIARTCFDDGCLGASFFFSCSSGEELKSARRFVTTIAVQLARGSVALRASVCDAIRAHPDIADQTLSDQWKQLVLGPCAKTAESAMPPLPLVFVIDALDECTDESGIAFVLQLVTGTSSLAASGMMLFLTSRPEIPIREGLEYIPASHRRLLILHRISPAIVDEDIRIFLEHNLGSLMRKRLLPDNSTRDIIEELVRSAGGLFIWAATACRFVLEGRPRERARLEMILQSSGSTTSSHPQQKLDWIYLDVLANAVREGLSDEEREAICSSLRTVLGAVAVLFTSLSAFSLDLLLEFQAGEVQALMHDLHSIFDVPDDYSQPIRPHHASVGDFLLDNRRCTDKRFWIDKHWAHKQVATQCLKIMEDNLKEDMCDLREPGSLIHSVDAALIDSKFPPHVRYTCFYWVHHVQCGGDAMHFAKKITSFLGEHFLHWLEALSLLRKFGDGVIMMSILDQLYVSKIYMT